MPEEKGERTTDASTSIRGAAARIRDRFAVAVAIGLALLSVVWALRSPPVSKLGTTPSVPPTLMPEMIPLVTGDEPLSELFTRAGCPVCHIIPGIPGANGRVGPPLVLGTTGMGRLNDPTYRGSARTVHEYIVESVLEPQRFIVQGYPEQTMPAWYGSKLSALALEKIAAYLERQSEESLNPGQ
mgnify:CR=1 FL=1